MSLWPRFGLYPVVDGHQWTVLSKYIVADTVIPRSSANIYREEESFGEMFGVILDLVCEALCWRQKVGQEDDVLAAHLPPEKQLLSDPPNTNLTS